MTISYHAHHSPIGADASFTVGKFGTRGGFGLELAGPADQDIYIGYRRGDGPARVLPFYEGSSADLAAFAIDEAAQQAHTDAVRLLPFIEEEMRRDLAWASDTWTAPDITVSLMSPFGSIPDPETADADTMRLAIVPAILARVTLDNSRSTELMTGFFALANAGAPLHLVSETGSPLLGLAKQRQWGFAMQPEEGVAPFIYFSIGEALAAGPSMRFPNGGCGGLMFEVQPGEMRVVTIALGFYREGIATSGIDATYYYTQYFTRLEEVLHFAVDHAGEMGAIAAARDGELRAAELNDEQSFLIAHATHSYYGNTEFLLADGRPVWAVNEGEYKMLNTFDLTVDMLFYELRWNPWTVRNVLDLFVDRYSYHDQVKHPDEPGRWYPGGISFTHDMGALNHFSPPGYSSYEVTNRLGCFSYMTHEQLTNWVLCAALYVHVTGDDAWLARQARVFRDCLHSLMHRDGRAPDEYDGIMNMDSSRCGSLGEEITTYDSLDVSLGQARNNLYLAGKTWASYVCLDHILRRMGDNTLAQSAADGARRCADTITARFDAEHGYIPAVFEAGNTSRIIPAVEGLVFPLLMGDLDAVSPDGRFGAYVTVLGHHLRAVLHPGVCIDATRHWWKMSSTSVNSWFSKVALCQFVARRILGVDFGDMGIVYDRAHADWQRVGSSGWAMCDQIVDGIGRGSKYYPRGVTNILWLEESPDTAVLTQQGRLNTPTSC